jgi:hypothetical protein
MINGKVAEISRTATAECCPWCDRKWAEHLRLDCNCPKVVHLTRFNIKAQRSIDMHTDLTWLNINDFDIGSSALNEAFGVVFHDELGAPRRIFKDRYGGLESTKEWKDTMPVVKFDEVSPGVPAPGIEIAEEINDAAVPPGVTDMPPCFGGFPGNSVIDPPHKCLICQHEHRCRQTSATRPSKKKHNEVMASCHDCLVRLPEWTYDDAVCDMGPMGQDDLWLYLCNLCLGKRTKTVVGARYVRRRDLPMVTATQRVKPEKSVVDKQEERLRKEGYVNDRGEPSHFKRPRGYKFKYCRKCRHGYGCMCPRDPNSTYAPKPEKKCRHRLDLIKTAVAVEMGFKITGWASEGVQTLVPDVYVCTKCFEIAYNPINMSQSWKREWSK